MNNFMGIIRYSLGIWFLNLLLETLLFLLGQWLNFKLFGITDYIFSRENKVLTCFSGSIG